jgi:hypothetical protein
MLLRAHTAWSRISSPRNPIITNNQANINRQTDRQDAQQARGPAPTSLSPKGHVVSALAEGRGEGDSLPLHS